MTDTLFTPINVDGITLFNRITMAPLYLGYAGEGGTVSPLLLEHYRMMASGGAAMIVVENATVDHPQGSGSNRTIRADTDDNLEGLTKLADTIKKQGAIACLQINHAGRFAMASPDPVAPSAVDTFGSTPRALEAGEIEAIVRKFADAAGRAKKAGFDMVELHGGTGYLLSQFASPRTNKRDDAWGGSLEERMKFPLDVLSATRAAVGNMPVGYRFLADEYLEDGLRPAESVQIASALENAGVSYLSVMGGTHESMATAEFFKKSRAEGFMAELAEQVKSHVSVPVITAGRISSAGTANDILESGKADLLGLARVLWADPEWPDKIRNGREDEIVHCDPACEDICMQLVLKGKPAYCPQWKPEKTRKMKDLFE